MTKKGEPMNIELQKHILGKKVRDHYERNRGKFKERPDIAAVLDNVDPALHLSENIQQLSDLGYLKTDEEKMKEKRMDEISEAESKAMMREKMDESLTPTYTCEVCGFESFKRKEMIHHFNDEHTPIEEMKEIYEDRMDYIILEYLCKQAVKEKNKYIKVSNMKLWKLLGKNVSNQKPRHLLDQYKLLNRVKHQKTNTIGYDQQGRRVYYISKDRLREAVLSTDYIDLIEKYDFINKDEMQTEMRVKPKPPSPISGEDGEQEDDTEGTEEPEMEDVDDWDWGPLTEEEDL